MQRQCRAPGSAKYQPFLDAERRAQTFDIGQQMGGRVVGNLAERYRAAGAALIENHDAPMLRVEEAPMHRSCAGAGSAVQKQRRGAARVPGLFPIHYMARVEPESSGSMGLDRW